MAFDAKYFGLIGGLANIEFLPMLFGYETKDSASTVKTAGYFNDVAYKLNVGDLITVVTLNSGGVPTAVNQYAVSAITEGVVSIVGGAAETLALDDLSDVTITSATEGDVLVKTATGWANAQIALDDLSDVTITSATEGQVLKKSATDWVNGTDATS